MIVDAQCARFDSIALEGGATLSPVEIAYESYGRLNSARSNAILITHAFTGDAHAAGISHDSGKPGWWDNMIGPGKAFDTDRFFVICSNVLGGCQGTTGPASINPATGKPYALSFPVITIRDMVRLQKMLIDSLGIEKLLCVCGGSMGGMQALEWAVNYPECVRCVIPIATTWRHSAQQIAFNEVGRQAIMADPDWNEGNYYDAKPPARGLAVARMVGHITYMSDTSMREKFGRRLRGKDAFGFSFSADFEVESYLRYRGSQFVDRFDANSYLYITKAMDYFDWLYPTYQSLETVTALRSSNIDVAFCELPSTYGHDAFLIETKQQGEMVTGFLDAVFREVSRARTRTAQSISSPERSDGIHGSEDAVSPQLLARRDYAMIAEIIEPGSRVLDLGCGDGELLVWLRDHKHVDGRGVEIDGNKVQRAMSRGVSVYQGDLDQGLADYADGAFDFVILSQTVQELRYPLRVLSAMLRVGRHAIVAFPNFGHWTVRLSHLTSGRAPTTVLFPYDWYESPNLHFLTIDDFILLCRRQHWIIERQIFLRGDHQLHFLPNLLAEVAVFSIQASQKAHL
jgi:homoserine O-acetyltransferase/O-succinyltransferase